MPYPDLYAVTYSYTGFQQAQGDNSFPGTQIDADFAGLQGSIDDLATFTELAIRSDGALNNGIVTFDSLSVDLQTAGLEPANAWITGTAYAANQSAVQGGSLYRALLDHTSGVFATDLAAGKWVLVGALAAGSQGPQGAVGPQGPQGVAGPTGPAGPGGAVSSIAGNTGAFTLGAGLKNATNVLLVDPAYMRGFLSGLTLSTAGSSSTFGVSLGVAADSTSAALMKLASAYTKTTGAWALGSGNGALDTGTIANSTWYHVFEIQRPDTGVVDILISLSATAPTLPANYTLFRRIGSMKTNGSAQWTAFTQYGDEFLWLTALAGDAVSASFTNSLFALSVPTGVRVYAKFGGYTSSSTNNNEASVSSPDQTSFATDAAASIQGSGASTFVSIGLNRIRTNTSAQIRVQSSNAAALRLSTFGWEDDRGRNL